MNPQVNTSVAGGPFPHALNCGKHDYFDQTQRDEWTRSRYALMRAVLRMWAADPQAVKYRFVLAELVRFHAPQVADKLTGSVFALNAWLQDKARNKRRRAFPARFGRLPFNQTVWEGTWRGLLTDAFGVFDEAPSPQRDEADLAALTLVCGT